MPPGALQLTPEKYLLTLNCSTFVSLLHSVNLTYLVNNTNSKYTILAPQDDVLSIFGEGDLPEKGSKDLERLLKYHFLPGRWMPQDLKDAQLLKTELDEPGLGGKRQVVEVELSTDDDKLVSSSSIRFGGVSIIGDPGTFSMIVYLS